MKYLKTNFEEGWSEKYKRSIDCNNPKGFSQRAHCQGKKKKVDEMEKLKGGLSDNMSLGDIAHKHKVDIKDLTKQFLQGIKVEMEHTDDKKKAQEIAMDHLSEDPKYYTKLRKMETKESMGADSAGSFEGPAFGKMMTKREIYKLHNSKLTEEEEEVLEVTDASSSGSYDVPFLGTTPQGRKNPLKIDGPESIKKSRAVTDPKFPKWGGPKGVFIKIKEKCKKFPYCNQGDINAIELLEIQDYITETSKNYGIPYNEMEKIVINEINKIFIEDMKPNEIDQIIENVITNEVRNTLLNESEGMKYEIYQVMCEGEPMECFKSIKEAEEHVDKLKKDHPGKQFIIEKKSYKSYGDMIDELEKMGEQLEEKENQNMENQEPMEGNSFAHAVLTAKKEGKKTFEHGGKTHDVEECWKQLEEEESIGEWDEEEECKECGEKSMEEKLVGGQHKLDKDKDGEITKKDFEMMRDMKEDNKEDNPVISIWQKYNESAFDENSPESFSDEFEYADNVINNIVQSAISNGDISEEDEDNVTDKIKYMFGLEILDMYKQENQDEEDDLDEDMCMECGDEMSMEEDMQSSIKSLHQKIYGSEKPVDEEKKVCEKCGKEICECGVMNESKKKVLRLTETELTNLIQNIINETVPGLEVVKRVKKDDKGTKEHMANVEKKMKDYLSFDGNDNPEFPKAVGKGEVAARQADEEENKEVADQRGGGLEDLNYDVEPSEKFKERLKKALEGHSTMGNSQDAAGVIKTDTGKKLAEKVKRKDKKEAEAPMYNKDPQPFKKLSESKINFHTIVEEEINKMKKLSSYNKKTQ